MIVILDFICYILDFIIFYLVRIKNALYFTIFHTQKVLEYEEYIEMKIHINLKVLF